jgi:Resolvase, N terminal domain
MTSSANVSVTQQFNTTTSMGRLTLNVLLSFAQFEREVTSERIRDARPILGELHIDMRESEFSEGTGYNGER